MRRDCDAPFIFPNAQEGSTHANFIWRLAPSKAAKALMSTGLCGALVFLNARRMALRENAPWRTEAVGQRY
jgi:hypothetical protein